MRKLALQFCLVCLLATAAWSKPEYVPDYFPAPLGAEWHYDVTSSMGTSLKMKNVVTEVTKRAEGGYLIVITSYTPQESVNYYHKVPGWVYIDKSVTPSSNYTFDFVEDKNDLMNPLAIGKTWSYEGTGSGIAVTQDWKVEGAEEVTVPAGKYKAIKVTSNGTMGGNPTKYTFWYVDRVGCVRIETESANPAGPPIISTTAMTKVVFPK